jgi:glycosyltransferase involved in cell wall biosynthesis
MPPVFERQADTENASIQANPLVSIVIPTYNRAQLLPEALDACLSQTYHNLEIVVVNDGSRDNTDELLASYASKDSRLRFVSKPNEGIPDTVNRGFRESRGRYVTWTSDDNYYYPEAIAEMVQFLESHPDVAMVYTDHRCIDGDGKDLGVVVAEEPESLEYHCAPAGCLLFRREVLDKVEPFRREWVRCHDFDFYHRIYRSFKVARLPKVLYAYRTHVGSMSGNYEAHMLEYCRLVSTWVRDRRGRAELWANGYAEIARGLTRDGRHWWAVGYLLRAARYEPRRLGAFFDAFWKAGYNSLPAKIRTSWRAVKHKFSH